MPVFCTQCGTRNVDGAAFCDECGHRLAPAAAPPAPPAPPVPAPPAGAAPPPAPVFPPPAPPRPAPVAPAPPPPTPVPPAQPVPPQPAAPAPPQPAAPAPSPAPVPPQPVAPVPPAPVPPAPGPGRTAVMPPPGGGATRPLTADPVDPGAGGPVARLVVLRGGQPVREHLIHGVSVEIGRWDPASGAFPEVDLTDDDPMAQVSRHHARLTRDGAAFRLEDRGSTNGTYVGRQKLSPNVPVELEPGAELIIGRTFLRFERV